MSSASSTAFNGTPAILQAHIVRLVAPRQIDIQTQEIPTSTLPPDHLLCETLVSAISPGTELAAYTGQPALRAGPAYPRLQGYCNVGRILAMGQAVKGFDIGDRILSFTSHRSHFAIPASEVLLRLPEHAPAGELACAYLFHLGYNAVLQTGLRAGSRVLVIGLGALGLTSVAMANAAGGVVTALSDQPEPSALALKMGARAVHGRRDEDALKLTLQGGADVVITTTNAWSDWEIALKAVAMRGTIACLGFPGRGEAPGTFNPLDSRYFYAKQLRIESVGLSPELPDSRGYLRFNERDNLRYIVDQIATRRLQPELLISGTYAGADIQRAYDDLLARKNSPITYLLAWNKE